MKISNFLLAIMLSITIIISSFTLTVLSKRFQINTIEKEGYVEIISSNTNISKEIVKNDLKDYIKNGYVYQNYENKEYEDYINYFPIKKSMYKYIYSLTIILLVICYVVFCKTKKKHNIYLIFFISSIILVLFYGTIYLTIDTNMIFVSLIMRFLHFILFIADLLFMESIINRKTFFSSNN